MSRPWGSEPRSYGKGARIPRSDDCIDEFDLDVP
jgi:hypothetical protein